MAQLDQVDIRTAPVNQTRESVIQGIVDISRIPLPFADSIGSGSHSNPKHEWSCDRLADPDTTNAVTDGSTATTPTQVPAIRLGNHAQISQKTVGTSTRVESTATHSNESLARYVQKATQELMRDCEAISLLNQASVKDTGVGGTAGKTAGLEAWIDEKVANQGAAAKSPLPFVDASGELTMTAAGSLGGWSTGTDHVFSGVDYTALTTAGQGSFASLKGILQALFELGAMPTKIMARNDVITALSSFMFTSTAQIATLQRDKGEGGAAQAQSSVNQIIDDNGIIVDLITNRLMQLSGDGTPTCNTLFAYDPSSFAISTQGGGIRSKELPVSGLGRAIQIHKDWMLTVNNPDALGAYICLDGGAWAA